MIINERTSRHENVIAAARQLLIAARTAPKARGVDIIEAALIEGDELRQLADRMVEIGNERNRPSFVRDAGNVLQSEAVVVIGTKLQSLGLNCGHCGFPTCAERQSGINGVIKSIDSQLSTLNSQLKDVPCVMNSIDVGIALGSACATAADLRLDTRIMYSIGVAAEELQFLGNDIHITVGIAISASSKSPFFDRPTK